jgi:hypothetical protein
MKKFAMNVPIFPPNIEKIETVSVLHKEAKAHQALAELKGFVGIDAGKCERKLSKNIFERTG